MINIWVLTDSRTGNNHQAIALAEKLTDKYTIDLSDNVANKEKFVGDTKHSTAAYVKVREDASIGSTPKLPLEASYAKGLIIRLEYNCLAKLPNFLLKYYPVHIKKEILQDILDKPMPDVIITAGRRTAVLAFYLKKMLKKDIKLVQIMRPSLPYEAFEAVILPYHDFHLSSRGLTRGSSNNFNITSHFLDPVDKPRDDKVIPINGAINNVTEKFATANLELKKHYPKLQQFIAVIIGGNSKKFNFTEKEAALFSSLLKTIYANHKIPLFISFSRRTPDPVKTIIKDNMPTSAIIYDPTIDAGFNPYVAMLANAKYIISTADSISMCSEAASSGKPLYIFCPSNFNSSKHKTFVKQLVDQKIAKMFDESVTKLEEYNYKPLNEAERVAEIIRPLI